MNAKRSGSVEAFRDVSTALDDNIEGHDDDTYQTPGLSASHCMTSQLGLSSEPGGMIITSRL
jgi:hypothetical protein